MTKQLPKATLIIPTYNERESLPRLVEAVLALPLSLNILVVDDNSPDGTGQWADEQASTHPSIKVIHRPSKLGLGTAYRAGFTAALADGADYVLVMDADFSHDPTYLPALLKRAEETAADLVIGSRYTSGGRMDSPWHRRLLSHTANYLVHRLVGLRTQDATSGFRCYRAAALQQLPLDKITSSGYSYLFEMVNLIQRAGGRIEEVPIVFRDRVLGQSKISRREIKQAWQTIWRLRRQNLAANRTSR